MGHSRNVRLLVIASLIAALTGCKGDSPVDPLDRIFKIATVGPAELAGIVGTVATPAPVVRVTDIDGYGVAGVEVTFAVTAGNGTVFPALVTTDASGKAWTLGPGASINTLKASIGALAPVVFSVKAAAGPPAAIERTAGDGQLAATGSVLALPLKARVLDAFGNPIAGASVSFTVVAGGGTINPASAVTDSEGFATAGWTLGPTAGLQTVRAQAGGAIVTFSADTYDCVGAKEAAQCIVLGELVFWRTSDSQIYRIRGDGKGLTKLTTAGINFDPVWSADGQRIAFIRRTFGFNNAPGTSDVHLMNADGSNLVRRTSKGIYESVAWSPDGQKLAVAGYTGNYSSIHIISVEDDGSPERVLTADGAVPAWSPDGRQIVYVQGTGYYDYSRIYVINADGTGAHPVSQPSTVINWTWGPAWSPDGQKISFAGCANSCTAFIIGADGSSPTAITESVNIRETAWSPDGKWLAVSAWSGSSSSINYVPVEGGSLRLVVADASHPSWRPPVR